MTSPSELLTAATRICAIADDQAMYRASINRLYYASYHQCYDYHMSLPLLGSVGTTRGLHEQLIAQLTNADAKLPLADRQKSVAIGKELRVICAKRVTADYDRTISVELSDMQQSQKSATSIFSNT